MPRPNQAKLARRLGARLRRLREEADLTQERLAWECDLSKPYLSEVEAGKKLPSLAVLEAISKRLKLELVDLLVLEPEQPRARLVEAARKKDRKEVAAALKALGLG